MFIFGDVYKRKMMMDADFGLDSRNDPWSHWNNSTAINDSIRERARQKGVPVIPPRKRQSPQDSNPVTAICGACGIEIRRIMHYSCSRDDCPCFKKVTF